MAHGIIHGVKRGIIHGDKHGNLTLGGSFSTKDATSNIFVPTSAAEFTSAGFPAPAHLWQCNEASGNLADSVGAKTLTASGTVVYQQAVSGWTTTAVGGAAAGVAGALSNNSMDNINANSIAYLTYSIWTSPASIVSDRSFYGASGVNGIRANVGGNVVRLITGANAANGALSHLGAVHPQLVVWDRTNQRNTTWSDIERINITWADNAGALLQFNVSNTDASYTQKILRIYSWLGIGAEYFTDATVKAMYMALGWTVSGY